MKTLEYIVSCLAIIFAIGFWMSIDKEADAVVKITIKESVKHSKSMVKAAVEGWSEKNDSTVVN